MEAIVSNFIKALGWSIVHSLWQGAIIYAILFVVFMAWPKLSAKLKHNLALGGLFLMFTSFCVTFFSIFEIPSAGGAIANISLNTTAYYDLSKMSDTFHLKTEAYFP